MATPPKKTSKQALSDAFSASKQELAPNEAPSDDPMGAPPEDPMAEQGESVDVQSLEAQVQHLQNVLLQKGIIAPQDIMAMPQVPQQGVQPMPPQLPMDPSMMGGGQPPMPF